MHSVLLATCAGLPRGDEDAGLLVEALAEDNVDGRWVVWNDPDVDWHRWPTVLRSTWDYPQHRPQFLEWIAAVPMLYNPSNVVMWNLDKVYLRDLEQAGVPVMPTVVVPPGTEPEFLADAEFVGQPYLSGVDTAGETALIYLDGVFSHAVTKAAMPGEAQAHSLLADEVYVEETIDVRRPLPAERVVGDQTVTALRARFGDLLYARVDVVPGPTGPLVLKVELTEPSLFLSYDECAAQRFAGAIACRT
jgi:hypothetical protein